MTIETSTGKTFEIRVICPALRNGRKILVELYDDRPLAQIAADFDGLASLTRTDSSRPGWKEVYEGYTQLVGVARNADAGTVRLTLEKEA